MLTQHGLEAKLGAMHGRGRLGEVVKAVKSMWAETERKDERSVI
jgi:hypothetical protein